MLKLRCRAIGALSAGELVSLRRRDPAAGIQSQGRMLCLRRPQGRGRTPRIFCPVLPPAFTSEGDSRVSKPAQPVRMPPLRQRVAFRVWEPQQSPAHNCGGQALRARPAMSRMTICEIACPAGSSPSPWRMGRLPRASNRPMWRPGLVSWFGPRPRHWTRPGIAFRQTRSNPAMPGCHWSHSTI